MRGLLRTPRCRPPGCRPSADRRTLVPFESIRSSGQCARLFRRRGPRTAAPVTIARDDLRTVPATTSWPARRNAIDTCLAIQPGERVALIADEPSREVAASLEQALVEKRRADRRRADRSGGSEAIREAAPPQVLAALERADAGILCVQPMEGELVARMAIVATVERRRIRYAHMIGVTPQIMREGMRADYRQVDRLSQQLCERMQTARG